jgi:hypothetical protein
MKCFLSHSSKDKESFVRKVAGALSPDIEYDEETFEPGERTTDAIRNSIQQSKIFVIFISNNSLESEHVLFELQQAKLRRDEGELKVLPLIIDSKIEFTDQRIPSWLKSYNLRPITSPSVAIRRIKSFRLQEIFSANPKIKEREEIFAGRNNETKKFEERMDDHIRGQPSTIVVSGLKGVGRKKFLLSSLVKASVINDNFQPVKLFLSRDDGIEGFISKLAEVSSLGNQTLPSLSDIGKDEKVRICQQILETGFASREVFLIEDEGCLVKPGGVISDWLIDIVEAKGELGQKICVASCFRPKKAKYVGNPLYYFISIPELSPNEILGLFQRYCKLFEMDLNRTELENFRHLLNGYPEQAFFAAQLIKSEGPQLAFENHHKDIAEFSENEANIQLQKYSQNSEAIEFLSFLARFEFFSIDLIIQVDKLAIDKLRQYFDDFYLNHLIEPIGGRQVTYYRVNEAIKNTILSGRLKLPAFYLNALEAAVEDMLHGIDSEDELDISAKYLVAQEALKNDKDIPERHLLPVHFLTTIRQLYDKRDLRLVIELADRVLAKATTMDNDAVSKFQYTLCQSLARLEDPRFLEEVQKVNGPEHNFLMGFYNRICGSFEKAQENLKKSLNHQHLEKISRGELVLVLIALDKFEEALIFARENFLKVPTNPYFGQFYFHCLVNQQTDMREEIDTVIKKLESIPTDLAQEMTYISKARLEMKNQNYDSANEYLNRASEIAEKEIYPIIAKLELFSQSFDLKSLEETLRRAEKINRNSPQNAIAIEKAKVIKIALQYGLKAAISNLDTNKKLPDSVTHRLRRKLISRSKDLRP